jgi:hypothetical protein
LAVFEPAEQNAGFDAHPLFGLHGDDDSVFLRRDDHLVDGRGNAFLDPQFFPATTLRGKRGERRSRNGRRQEPAYSMRDEQVAIHENHF